MGTGGGYRWWHLPALTALPFLKVFREMHGECIWEKKEIMDGKFSDKEHMRRAYQEWHDGVVKHVPAAQLLIWDVKKGFAPLCAFLERPLPEDTTFPHSQLTDGKTFQKLKVAFTGVSAFIVLMPFFSIPLLILLWLG